MNQTIDKPVVEDTKSILDRTVHARLLQDIERVAEIANVPVHMLHFSMKNYCSASEIEWVKQFNTHVKEETAGYCMTKVDDPSIRMQAMTAALLRNFIDARVVTVETMLEWAEEDDPPIPTVLLVPNFSIVLKGDSFPSWKVQKLYDILMTRYVSGKQTVVYIESLSTLAKNYGQQFAEFIKTRWVHEDKK